MIFNDMNRIFIEGVALELVKKMGHELLLSMVYSMTMTQIQYFIQNPERFEDKISREQAFNLVWGSFRN